MSAKKHTSRPTTPPPAISNAPSPAAGDGAAEIAAEPMTPWIESSDPRRRMIGKVVLVAIWVYVAALWLLALDQWFNWGIFGPKIPPIQ